MTKHYWANILDWRNNPEVYIWTRTNRFISLREHMNWFNLRENNLVSEPIFCYFLDESLVGMSRLDLVNHEVYEISIIVSPDHRGKGFGTVILCDTCEYFVLHMSPRSRLIAWVHSQNKVSLGLFEARGFKILHQENQFLYLDFSRDKG